MKSSRSISTRNVSVGLLAASPDGLAVARMDGSASWVLWKKLVPIRQGVADTIYYERR